MRPRVSIWIEPMIEAMLLALFMMAAAFFGTLIAHPASPWRHSLVSPWQGRALMGTAMGLTAMALIYSPWGRRSGAHMNPAVTLAYWRLQRIRGSQALLYIGGQVVGGILGLGLAVAAARSWLADPSVDYVATRVGTAGILGAWMGEFCISALLMTVILWMTSRPVLRAKTGLAAGVLVALFIILEAPLSGMSMNPARSLASEVYAGGWHTFWVYVTAPVLGMMASAEIYQRSAQPVACAKLMHASTSPCQFCGGKS